MDSESLRSFLAVFRHASFSNAARALGRTQPAVSMRIATLEEALGVPLFERTHGRVALSAAGEALLPHALRALASLEDGAAAVNALRAKGGGPVALAVVGTLAGPGLTRVLKAYAAGFPDVTLALRTATSAQVSEIVRRGEATIGLRYLHDPALDLRCEALGGEALVIVCAPEHRLAGKRVQALRTLQAEPWFAFPVTEGEAAAGISGVFAQQGIAGIQWTAVDSLTAQKRLVEAGYGLALVPASSVQEELSAGSLSTIRVAGFAPTNPVTSVVRREGYLSPAADRLLSALQAGLLRTAAPRSRRQPRR